jgi:hypothetical protein
MLGAMAHAYFAECFSSIIFQSQEHITRFYSFCPDIYSELLTIAESGRCHQPIKPIDGRNYCDAFRDESVIERLMCLVHTILQSCTHFGGKTNSQDLKIAELKSSILEFNMNPEVFNLTYTEKRLREIQSKGYRKTINFSTIPDQASHAMYASSDLPVPRQGKGTGKGTGKGKGGGKGLKPPRVDGDGDLNQLRMTYFSYLDAVDILLSIQRRASLLLCCSIREQRAHIIEHSPLAALSRD